MGNLAENRFASRMKAFGHVVESTTSSENINGHIDFRIDGQRVDVKGPKKIHRDDAAFNYDRLLVEWWAADHDNKDGTFIINRAGWVRAVDLVWLAFEQEQESSYLWVKRTELEEMVRRVEWHDPYKNVRYTNDYEPYKRIGVRRGDFEESRGVFCYVPRQDILSLPSTKISVDMPAGL
jgi:hypothetical protein